MENQTGMMYEFKFNPTGYEFREINAAFYTFLGARLYSTFDRILSEDSRVRLKETVDEKRFGSIFVLNVFAENGELVPMACRLMQKNHGDNVEVRMLEIERLFSGYCGQLLREKETIALLAQYENVYYTFDPQKNSVVCYRYDVGKEIIGNQPIDEWANSLVARVSEDCREVVDKFCTELKNGTRSIEYMIESKQGKSSLHLTGTAIYFDDFHIMTVGRIGDPYKSSNHEFVRRDQLTGLFLKDNITNFAKRRINELNLPTAIAIIDVDDFKNVNDNFGHSKGDEVLKKCASIIEAQSDGFGKAGRIGGDEFLLIFDNFINKEHIRNVLRAIKNSIAASYKDEIDGFHVTTSIGLSVYPDDIDASYDELFKLADCLLYRAKSKGKNRYVLYDREKHGSVESILQSGIKTAGLLGSRGIEKSEVVCKITSMVLENKEYPLDNILNDIVTYFGVERIIVYNKTDKEVVAQCGKKLLNSKKISKTIDYLYSKELEKRYQNGTMIINNTKRFSEKDPAVYEKLVEQGTLSFIHRVITGKDGKTYIVSYEAVTDIITWNLEDMHYFRIFDMVFEKCL